MADININVLVVTSYYIFVMDYHWGQSGEGCGILRYYCLQLHMNLHLVQKVFWNLALEHSDTYICALLYLFPRDNSRK